MAERYSIAHPDLCWVCFNINLKCDHKLTRWSDLVQSVQLWVEVQEINDYGQYSPVTVLPREDVEVGGVVQLKQVLHYRPVNLISCYKLQGQQRRIVVRIRQVPNSGNLPVTVHSVEGVR